MFELAGLAVAALVCVGVIALVFKLLWGLMGLVLLPIKLVAVGIFGLLFAGLALLLLPAVAVAVPFLVLLFPVLLVLAPLLLIGLLVKAFC